MMSTTKEFYTFSLRELKKQGINSNYIVILQMRLGVYIYFSLLFNVIAFQKISFIPHRVIGTFGFKVVVLL